MPTGQNTFDAMTDGATPSTSNTGGTSGQAISSISVGAASSIQASNDRPVHGPMGIAMTLEANVAAAATRLMWAVAESARLVFSCHFEIDTVPTSDEEIMHMRHASGNVGVLSISTDSKFYMKDATGTAIAGGVSKSTASVLADTKYRCDMARTKGTGTGDGHLAYSIWTYNPTTGAETLVHSWSSNTVNAGTADTSHVAIGRTTGRAQANFVYYDTVRWQTLSSGYLSAFSQPNQPPTAVLSADATGIEPGRVITLSVATSDPDGTVVSTSIVQESGLPTVALTGPSNTRSYIAPPTTAGTSLGFQAVVTDDDGAETSSNIVTHVVLASTELVVRSGALSPAYVQVGNTP